MHVGDNISTVGVTSVLWRVFSTVEGYLQYCGGLQQYMWRLFSTVGDNISTVGDSFSTVEGIQYIGG